MNKPLFLCTGSDRRQVYAARRLSEACLNAAGQTACVYTFNTDGCPDVYGTADKVRNITSLDELPEKIDMLVLPMPCSNGLSISCAYGKMSCGDFVPYLNKNAIVTGGAMCAPMTEYFSSLGFETKDYYKREELVIKNCVPTAEGALFAAMRELDVTIRDLDVLICGWGRVAKACGRLFGAVGANVAAAARKREQLADAESMGFGAVAIDRLGEAAADFRLIVNTIPAMVLTDDVISRLNPSNLIIDLASKPGGTDFESCAGHNIRAIHALSIPGKYAPVTAGEIIADAVINIYNERSGTDVT